ncbi:MAG: hypothetical protein ACRDOK_30880, partial [Streptosporangiaceae bacterium]
PVQIRSGLLENYQVKDLIADHSGQALIICPWFVREISRHRLASGAMKRGLSARRRQPSAG